jgi:hypothetical protein
MMLAIVASIVQGFFRLRHWDAGSFQAAAECPFDFLGNRGKQLNLTVPEIVFVPDAPVRCRFRAAAIS